MAGAVKGANLVFYTEGNFPVTWEGSEDKEKSGGVHELVMALMKSPLFASGPYLGARSYMPNSLKQVPFHKSVQGEPIGFFDKNRKRSGVTGDDKVILRGAQHIEGKWVVYYSTADNKDRLIGMLYETFQGSVWIHRTKEGVTLPQFAKVIGGPGLVKKAAAQFEVKVPPSK